MTILPAVTVTRVEAQQGWLIACTCTWHAIRPDRWAADLLAVTHRASHGPTPALDAPVDYRELMEALL